MFRPENQPDYQAKLVNSLNEVDKLHQTTLYEAKGRGRDDDKLKEEAKSYGTTFKLLKDHQANTYIGKTDIETLKSLTRILPNGADISLLNPTFEQLDLPAIIKNLCNIPRFGGSAQHMGWEVYSVAAHLLLGNWLIGMDSPINKNEQTLVRKYWLAHDMQEGSMGLDVPTPWKIVIKELAGFDLWQMLEDRHSSAIHHKLGLEWPVPKHIEKHVKHIDAACLVNEAHHLLRQTPEQLKSFPDIKPIDKQVFSDFVSNALNHPEFDTNYLLMMGFDEAFGSELANLKQTDGFRFTPTIPTMVAK